MKVFSFALVACVLLCAGCGGSPQIAPSEAPSEATPTATAAVDPAKAKAFNEAIQKEPKVVDFVYDPTAAFQWTIGVHDDGSPRHGYAEYFCGLMHDYGLPTEHAKVRIVDYTKFMQPGGNAHDASLGSVDCATSEHMTP